MTIHHLNCGGLNPPSQWLAEGTGSLLRRGRAVCHCLLLETDEGLVLVDSGLGLVDIRRPYSRLGIDVALLLHPSANPGWTARGQVEMLGHDPADVRHILTTHLDVDHRGGLGDFPNATVHVSRREIEAATDPRTFMDRRRYSGDWLDSVVWSVHDPIGSQWEGLPVLFEMQTTAGAVRMVQLFGHSSGHCGVVIDRGPARSDPRFLFHVGDSIQHRSELGAGKGTPWGIRGFNTLMQADRVQRQRSRDIVRNLATSPHVDVICSHDPTMFDQHRATA